MIPHLSPVPDDGLFQYPIARSERLDGQSFVKWHHHRWLASDMCIMANFEVKGMARDLFDLAQTQSPMGTLPRNKVMVARLLRTDPTRFDDLCRLEFGPMSGWSPCITDDGELRLYHPVVLEQVQDALNRREAWLASKSAAAVREQRRRLVAAMRQMGVDARVVADEALIERMDDWLAENWKAKRGAKAYHAVMVEARERGWFGNPTGFDSKR